MAALLSHLVIYAAVNAFLVVVWVLMGSGSVADLQAIAREPASALDSGFWPIWSILVWGTLVVIHAGLTASHLAFGKSSRRRRQRIAREAAKAGRDIAKEVGVMVGRAHGRRTTRRIPAVPAPPSATQAASSGRRWVTVMFSDIAGSTKLNEELGDEEWHRVLTRVRGIVRKAIVERSGREVGTQGDGSLVRFDSPADAVLCAIDIQAELHSARGEGETVPGVRIGVHAGEAVEDEGDLVGRVINLASRVTDEAQAGEILVTEPVADQLVGRLELEDKGLRELRGLAQPRHLLAVKWSDGKAD